MVSLLQPFHTHNDSTRLNGETGKAENENGKAAMYSLRSYIQHDKYCNYVLTVSANHAMIMTNLEVEVWWKI